MSQGHHTLTCGSLCLEGSFSACPMALYLKSHYFQGAFPSSSRWVRASSGLSVPVFLSVLATLCWEGLLKNLVHSRPQASGVGARA